MKPIVRLPSREIRTSCERLCHFHMPLEPHSVNQHTLLEIAYTSTDSELWASFDTTKLPIACLSHHGTRMACKSSLPGLRLPQELQYKIHNSTTKPKDQKKTFQSPPKAEISGRAAVEKMIQEAQEAALAKFVKQFEKPAASPGPFKPQVKKPSLHREAPFTREHAIPMTSSDVTKRPVIRIPANEDRKLKIETSKRPASPLELPQEQQENMTKKPVVRIPTNDDRKPMAKKPFPFLKLPQELQDQVYGYLFDHPLTFHIKFGSPKGFGRKALTYRLPNQPASAQPKFDEKVRWRRRRLDYPRRVRSTEKDIPAYRMPTGFLSLFHVHPRVAAGAAKFFYSLHTFRFTSMRVLRTFMDMIAPYSKEAIRNLEIKHYTAGNRWVDHRIWKAKFDYFYEMTLWRIGDELTGLQSLKLDLCVNEIPLDFGPEVDWRKPFEALQDMNLSSVQIRCHTTLEEHRDAMEVESYLIEQELLAEEFRVENKSLLEHQFSKEEPEALLPVLMTDSVTCNRSTGYSGYR